MGTLIRLPNGGVAEFDNPKDAAEFALTFFGRSERGTERPAIVRENKGIRKPLVSRSVALAASDEHASASSIDVLELVLSRGHITNHELVKELGLKSARSLSGISSKISSLVQQHQMELSQVLVFKRTGAGLKARTTWFAGKRILEALSKLKGEVG